MYGLIIDHIATYIKEKYGESTWSEVKFVSGVTDDTFQMDKKFSEGLSHKLIWACHDVTGDPVDELMTNIGTSFYKFLTKFEFNKVYYVLFYIPYVLRVLGRTFPQFLNGLDNLHEYLRFTFPKLKPPSFYCEHESRTGLTLHYRSKRRGFLHYVQGQIRNISQELFQTEVVIELLDIEHDLNLEHVIMRLHFNNLDFNRQGTAYRNLNDSILEKVKITSDIFFDIFPFIIVFNRGMRIRNIGIGLLRVMAGIVGKKINQTFLLMRPFIRFRWEEVRGTNRNYSFDIACDCFRNFFASPKKRVLKSVKSQIMLHSNNIFELISSDPIQEDEDGILVYKTTDVDQMTEERHRMGDGEREKFLSLKGQMFYMEEWESICFVGIPVMSHLPQMYKSGLFINDFALHDSSRDLVLASTQQSAELKLLLHQEAQKSRNMRENMNRLKKERRRTDKLLYQMLPKSVANQLRHGESAVACCERFDSVTILFTDIVEFTKMCSSLTPLEVIEFLKVIYTNFDKIIDTHGVYKVETIGDAYMVVSGAPTKTEHDAEFILDCASQFLVEAGKMVNMNNKIHKIDIRAGVHSGSVVAGVVGLSMPRYCLFGETVYVANKMEQNSSPMKILVSETTHNKIEESDPGLYQFERREEIEIKDDQTIQTFFVVSRHGPHRVPSPRNCESRQDDSQTEDDDDDELLLPRKSGRKSPTSEAEEELKKKGQLSFTPVSDAGIECHSRNSNKTPRQICDQMVNVSFVISVCRSNDSISLVAELARISQVPTIQVDLNYWSLPLNFNGTSVPTISSPSYTTMVLSTLVFQNVITDIFADLNITPNSTVLYDNMYPPDFTAWRDAFSVLPGIRFVPMETTVLRMRAQITQLRMASINSLILVAKTENVERFTLEAADFIEQRVFNTYVLTKVSGGFFLNDITAFKCDSCESAFMFWLRPFPVGKLMEIRDLDDYLFRNEIGLELDYSINGWDSLNVAFYMNVMGYAFETIRTMNATFDVLPTFTCQTGPSEPNITTTVRDIILNDPAHEYGNYTEAGLNMFFQDVEVRIYKIDRDRDHEDALFNKEVGVWSPISKLSVMYGTLQVDVRNLNIFRVVTLIVG
nr:hypothetical protein T07D1.1 - Caenorhabditis elegans [Caenorhabditis elegans]